MSARSAIGVLVPWATGLLLVGTALDAADSSLRMWLAVLLCVAQAAALTWRQAFPERVAVAVMVMAAANHALVPAAVIPFGAAVVVWSFTSVRPPQRSSVALVAALAVTAIGFVDVPAGDVVFIMVVLVCVWALAEARRSRRAAIEQQARRAVRDEQARIARELHDVIAHSVTVMVVQASAAGDVFDRHPEQARVAIAAIEEVGRTTLAELRRLLGSVHLRDDEHAEAPQPGLERLDELVAPLRAAGLSVQIVEEGAGGAAPAGVEVSAYRIIQEALTNVLRHAGATRANVTLRRSPGTLEIEVVDNGRGSASRRSTAGTGLGLVGMRERAALLGGSLDAAPTAHGGFRVHARLPLDPSP
jgi:signal transduction histidine kinase